MEQHGAKCASVRDREILRFIGEQFVVTLPQLAALIGRSDRSARWVRTRLERAGWIDARPFFAWEPTFVWLTGAGLRVAGLPYKLWHPAGVGSALVKMAALTDVRLAIQLEFPEVVWTSRRELSARRVEVAQAEHIPDALLEIEGATAAVELVEEKLDGRSAVRRTELSLLAYGSVVFFASTVAAKRLHRLVERESGVAVVEFARDPRRPGALVLPPLRELIPSLEVRGGPVPSVEREVGKAPSREWGALPAGGTRELPAVEQTLGDVRCIRPRSQD